MSPSVWHLLPSPPPCFTPTTCLAVITAITAVYILHPPHPHRRLVAPVYTYQAASRSVYLPSLTAANGNANATWVYWFNQTSYGTGGSRVTLNTPITEFPLFYIQRASESVREPVK